MALAAGTRLGPYEIAFPLGAGPSKRHSRVAVEVISRVVDEKFVIDKENITGISEGKKHVSYGTVIYEISDGLIRKEWYLPVGR